MKGLILKNTASSQAEQNSPFLQSLFAINSMFLIVLNDWTIEKHRAYVPPVPTHSELSLATHFVVGAQPPQAVFLCPSSGFACSMVSHGGIPSGMPSSNFIGSPTPHDLPPILANGRKLNTNNQEVGVS